MAQQADEDLHVEDTPGYKPPAEKSLTEIIKTDADDESLVKYKQALLGAGAGDNVIVCEYHHESVQGLPTFLNWDSLLTGHIWT